MNSNFHIDLSLYLNKKIKVTYRNGSIHADTVIRNDSGGFECSHPYSMQGSEYNFRKDGTYSSLRGENHSHDIVKIELVEQPKYHHLENQVKEMQRQIEVTQAEIQRLKNEEENTIAEFAGYKAMLEKGGALDDSVVFYHPNGEVCKRIPRHVMMRLAKQMSS
jgi:hypothetical protein